MATSAATALRSAIAAMAIMSVERSILRGRPPIRPRARAAASNFTSTASTNAHPSACARGGQTGHSALCDKFPFELGKRRENAKRQAPVGGRRIDLCACPGQHLQSDAAGAQIFDRVNQMAQITAESVEFPQHERVAGLDRLE